MSETCQPMYCAKCGCEITDGQYFYPCDTNYQEGNNFELSEPWCSECWGKTWPPGGTLGPTLDQIVILSNRIAEDGVRILAVAQALRDYSEVFYDAPMAIKLRAWAATLCQIVNEESDDEALPES